MLNRRMIGLFLKTAVCLAMLLLSMPGNVCGSDAVTADLLQARYDRINRLLKDGRLDDALQQALRTLDMARGLYGQESAGTAPAIDRVAAVYRAMGRFADAETNLIAALDLVRRGPDLPPEYTVSALNNLAGLYREMGRYGDAEALYLRAVDMQKSLRDESGEGEAALLSNLAVLYMNLARYADAEPLLKRVLAMAEKKAEPDRLSQRMKISMDGRRLEWGRRMLNLANLYFEMKRHEDAESLTMRALGIFQPILGEEHPEVARVKGDLGVLYSATGQYARAEKLLTEAINSASTAYGDKPQPVVAEYYVSLAQLYQEMGNYRDALKVAGHALPILQNTLGGSHPKTLRCLNTIAVIHIYRGEYEQAESVLRQVLETARASLGSRHESLAVYLSNLGNVLAARGRHREANRMFAGAIGINEQKREDAFLILSEQQKLNYVSSMLHQVKLYLSHLLQHGASDPEALGEAMTVWLRWKGAVQEAQGRYGDALYRSDDPVLRRKFDELVRVRRELGGIQLFGGQAARQRGAAETASRLEKRKQALEAELSGLSRDYAFERRIGKVDIARLTELLPPDAVYVDFAEIAMTDFSRQMPGRMHYAAFVVASGGKDPVRLLDIADRDALDAVIGSYLKEMRKKAAGRPDHDPTRLERDAVQLYRMLLNPLLPGLNVRTRLYVSPDGLLNLIPLEVLKSESGRYAVEDYRINYVASGRDLARFDTVDPPVGRAVILADPDFDLKRPGQGDTQTPAVEAAEDGRRPAVGIFSGVHFDRLPDTKQEAEAIGTLLKASGYRVDLYEGREAVEENLFAVRHPRILHIATHGYFLNGNATASAATRGVRILLQEPVLTNLNDPVQNPMLRSGVALAGANASIRVGTDHGLVSAERVLGLNLRGTDLVTLSACETGTGDIRAGEGVFGLKRAFLMSGAKTLMMSLWNVPSAETTTLMTEFYTRMSRGALKASALREAKLKMMKQNPHPFYWGAFIMVGKPE
ncbi:MAG: CHAT domain-containing protein [Syntrophales bacterium]|nr:CHAT domain-containing protein [Syntrophales bacterium]